MALWGVVELGQWYAGVKFVDICIYSSKRKEFYVQHLIVTDVPTWLKSLRLHKYAYLFQQMTYEEMLSVSEEWLETQVGVSSWG